MEKQKLQEWANNNNPDESLIWKNGFWDQVIFIRDEIKRIFATSDEDWKFLEENITVVSTHVSKSVTLPVYHIVLPNDITMIIRYNFHDWKVSISSEYEIEIDFLKIFTDTKDNIPSCYCEGFDKSWIYGPYEKNKKQFTIEINSGYYQLYTFLWILKEGLNNIKKDENV